MEKKQNFKWKNMTMGVCYYPEQWDRDLWAEDLDRMLKTGISVIRVAEFAWNKFEPEEGKYTFDFFDGFLKLCSEKGMKVILGTPSATPPAWLTEKYPETLNATRDGVLYRHGGRRHYNYNSEKYRELVSGIVVQLAQHYGKSPTVIGWQIDNELNCEVDEFYSNADTIAFRRFLKEKYNTLEELNRAWGTAFWNQTYTDWEQIYVPRPVINKSINPHMHLDYIRFISDSMIRFCRMQADIIRKYKADDCFITTNGMFGNADNHRMERECLDIYSFDSYPDFAYGLDKDPHIAAYLRDRYWTKQLTDVRSVCPHFGIMEQQSGANGWTTRMEAPAPRPGQINLWAMQSIANGADYISFFRWRTSIMGTEIYWHGILDYDNRDNRKLEEVKSFFNNMKKLEPVCGADSVAAFALIKDYDNEWDAKADMWHQRPQNYSEDEIFAASELSHTPYDTVYLQKDTTLEDLCGYPVVVYPHPVIMNEERSGLLKEYVEQGGTLVIGCRSAYKDMTGKCVMQPQPGLLSGLSGSDVTEFTFTSPYEEMTYCDWDGTPMAMPVFNDIMEAKDGGQVLAEYSNQYFSGKAALIEKKTGKGRTLHLGSAFSRENFCRILEYTGAINPFGNMIDAPETVSLYMRQKNGNYYLFVLNFLPSETEITLQQKMMDMFTNEYKNRKILLGAYEAAVFQIVS